MEHAPTRQDLLIRGGRVIDPDSGRDELADVLVRDGLVDAIGNDTKDPATS